MTAEKATPEALILAHGGSWDLRFQISSLAASIAATGGRVDIALFFAALDAWVNERWDLHDPAPPLLPEQIERAAFPALSDLLEAGRESGLIRVYACSASTRLLELDLARVQGAVDAVLGWQTFSQMIAKTPRVVTL